MSDLRLSVARDFSRTPGSRYDSEGDFSGETFRRAILLPRVEQALHERKQLLIDLDGTAGYGTSFLEEAFGGLVRENKIPPQALRSVLRFKSTEEDYLVEDILGYIDEAARTH